MKMAENRVDASLLTEQERASLQPLLKLVRRNPPPSLQGADGTQISLPEPIFEALVKVLQAMRHGQAVVLMPEAREGWLARLGREIIRRTERLRGGLHPVTRRGVAAGSYSPNLFPAGAE